MYCMQSFEPSEAELRAAAAGTLDGPDAAHGSGRTDVDVQGKAAKKHKGRGGKLAASLSAEEVSYCRDCLRHLGAARADAAHDVLSIADSC